LELGSSKTRGKKGKHRSRFSAPKERRKDKEPFLEEMATEKR
jgi:hypothetical protein